MTERTLGERLAVVEERVEAIVEAGDRREEKQNDIFDEIRGLTSTVQEFKEEMARYRGFMGGIAFVVTGVGILLSKFASPLWTWLKGH